MTPFFWKDSEKVRQEKGSIELKVRFFVKHITWFTTKREKCKHVILLTHLVHVKLLQIENSQTISFSQTFVRLNLYLDLGLVTLKK